MNKILLPILLAFNVSAASASTLTWTDWSASTTGTLNFGSSTVGVSYSGPYDSVDASGSGIAYYYNNPVAFSSVVNGPTTGLIRLNGGSTATRTISFNTPVVDPYMALVSVGQPGLAVDYNFDAPFTIVSQGCGSWGCGTLSNPSGNTLLGNEGNGVIKFTGTFSQISWTTTQAEYWHGFTVGAVAPVPVPTAAWLLCSGLLGLVGIARRKAV